MKTKKELQKIADRLLPIQKMFFKHGKGWMLDSLRDLSKEEYQFLERIVAGGDC